MTLLDRPGTSLDYGRDVTLLDLADRLLDKGVVISGDIVISVAGVDLVYLSLRALLASVETVLDLDLASAELFR
ncbi:MAG TPA: gas vesicle protein GvpJ [Acidimicrobiales bacterium]|nr:gas vesicle protein GvpJ [Acidimicrobiales bacterium]